MPLGKFFSPFSCKSLHLKNRIVMAPMTRVFCPNGIPTPEVTQYYQRRAEGEVGLIITEGTVIERPASKNEANIPNFFGAALPHWQEVAEAVHAKGGAIVPQLWHTGVAKGRDANYAPTPLDSPSGLTLSGNPLCEAMSEADIADTIAAFARAAGDAKRLGFDGIELHGAHGYLIDEFFWSQTNRRGDSWGGDTIGARAKFGAEIVKACRAAVGDDFAIILRISQWKTGFYDFKNAPTPADLEDWVAPLVAAGVDIIHCSQRRFWEPEYEGSDLNFAGWVKKISGKPTITVGSVGLSGEFIAAFRGESSTPTDIKALLERLNRDEFDLVGVGRALLVDPQWAIKIKENRLADILPFEARALFSLY